MIHQKIYSQGRNQNVGDKGERQERTGQKPTEIRCWSDLTKQIYHR